MMENDIIYLIACIIVFGSIFGYLFLMPYIEERILKKKMSFYKDLIDYYIFENRYRNNIGGNMNENN